MNQSSIQTDLIAAKKLIDDVDLTQTIERLIKVDGWSPKHAVKAAEQYRRFLFLKKKYGETHILPPSYDMDEVWHAHILHTEDYCNFCETTFGAYLHHHPHHGKDNSITDEELSQIFEDQTQKLYRLEFGEDIQAIRPLPLRVMVKRLIEFFKTNAKASQIASANAKQI